jgi:hypothetical protein
LEFREEHPWLTTKRSIILDLGDSDGKPNVGSNAQTVITAEDTHHLAKDACMNGRTRNNCFLDQFDLHVVTRHDATLKVPRIVRHWLYLRLQSSNV